VRSNLRENGGESGRSPLLSKTISLSLIFEADGLRARVSLVTSGIWQAGPLALQKKGFTTRSPLLSKTISLSLILEADGLWALDVIVRVWGGAATDPIVFLG